MSSTRHKALDSAEALIVAGDLAGARATLKKLRPNRIPRPLRAHFANLARRAQLPLLALSSLAKLLHPSPGAALSGLPPERIEYGFALAKLGLLEESISVLQSVDSSRFPQALMGICAARFTRWDYELAIPLLQNYLTMKSVGPYERLIAEVNLCAALVATERHEQLDPVLAHAMSATRAQGLGNLHGTLCLLSAQYALSLGDYAAAGSRLAEAKHHLDPMGGRYPLLTAKWEVILSLFEEGPTPDNLARLDALSAKAGAEAEWETVRHLVAHRALFTQDRAALARVFHGTPHAGFKKWLSAKAGELLHGARSFTLELNETAADGSRVEAPLFTPRSSSLEIRTLKALCSDVFRPLRLPELHPLIYPGEIFDPDLSLPKVKFAIASLRRRLQAQGSSIYVEIADGGYRLSASRPLRVHVQVEAAPDDRADASLTVLGRAMGDSAFSAQEAATALGISERSARRLLADAVAEGRLTREGRASRTRYRFSAGARQAA